MMNKANQDISTKHEAPAMDQQDARLSDENRQTSDAPKRVIRNLRKRLLSSFLYSLRGRFLFLICLATFPAIIFTFIAAENERTAALVRTEREALHLAGLASREHTHQIQGARQLLRWLGSKFEREGLNSPIITDPDYLRSLLAGHQQLANIGVLAPDGQVLSSAYPLASYRRWNTNPAYLAALRSTEVATGTYLISPIFDRPTLNHAFAVREKNGRVIAVLFNGLNLDWLSEMARQSDLPEGFSLLVADREGQVLAYGGSDYPEIADRRRMHIPGIIDAAKSKSGKMLAIDSIGTRRYIVATALGESLGLYVGVEIPYERILAQSNRIFSRTLISLGLLTLFTIAAVFLAAELGLLRGIRSLARTAQRFGAGELNARAKAPRGHNEFSSLARAFNTMADSLATRHREALNAHDRLRALTARLHVAREEEAARISRELHDEIGQILTSLKINLARLQACCQLSGETQRCAIALQASSGAMNQQIENAMGFVRRISSDLRPNVLDKLGLIAALEWQARETESHTGLAIQVEADAVDDSLGELVSVTLFRIAQEALTNIVRHAQAHVVEIILTVKEAEALLTIRDDGSGISANEVTSSDSLGLIGMRERAMLINGYVTITGTPGNGTTVCVTVPFQHKQKITDEDFIS